MKRNKLGINTFFGLSYFVLSFLGALIPDQPRNQDHFLNTSSANRIEVSLGGNSISTTEESSIINFGWESSATEAKQPIFLNSTSHSQIKKEAFLKDFSVTSRDRNTSQIEPEGIYTFYQPNSLRAITSLEELICSAEPNTGLTLLKLEGGLKYYTRNLQKIGALNMLGAASHDFLANEHLKIGTQYLHWADANEYTETKTGIVNEDKSLLTRTFSSQNAFCTTPSITRAQQDVICVGEKFRIAPVNTTDGVVPAGTTYTWTIKINNADISGKSPQAVPQTVIEQTLTHSTNETERIEYEVTPTSGSCVGQKFVVVV